MSNQAQMQQAQTQQSEIKKSPFDQTFICPKCSEILFTKIFYFEGTNTPQVQFTCPKKHSGMVDLALFFDLFYSSNQEIENELSKFEEELEKDIESYRKKKLLEKQKAKEEDEKDASKSKEKDSKNTNGDNSNENDNKITNENNKNGGNIINNANDINTKAFKELEIANKITFTLFNDNKNNEINVIKNSISTPNVNDNIKINNNNISNNKNFISKKSKEKKAIAHKVSNNINTIRKIHSSEKEEKLIDEKFICKSHNKRHIGYCLSCKKHVCLKCLKLKKHKTKMFKHMKITEKNLNELNKLIGQCQESLNKFEKKCKLIIDSLSLNNEKEKDEKLILYIMSNNLIEINREYLSEVKIVLKNYNTCVKNKAFNYEIILSIKNIKIKNNLIIPNDNHELLAMIKDYKEYLFEKNISTENINNNRYLLFEAFNEKAKGMDVIDFSSIMKDEKFRGLINLSDFKSEDLNEKIGQDEKEMHEIEKISYDTNDFEDGGDIDELLDDEEEENEYEDDDEYGEYDDDEDINNDEDENNYGDNEDVDKANEEK
jgi:hypothetical protein